MSGGRKSGNIEICQNVKRKLVIYQSKYATVVINRADEVAQSSRVILAPPHTDVLFSNPVLTSQEVGAAELTAFNIKC